MNTTAYKILDAPGIIDDYYLNLLDWSADGILSLAIKERVYLWNNSSNINKLCDYGQGNYIGSLMYNSLGNNLAIGKYDGSLISGI